MKKTNSKENIDYSNLIDSIKDDSTIDISGVSKLSKRKKKIRFEYEIISIEPSEIRFFSQLFGLKFNLPIYKANINLPTKGLYNNKSDK